MEKKTTSRKKTPKYVPTLLQTIERVVELSKDSQMSDEFMLQAAPEVGFLAEKFGISERQAVLFCVCMERGPRRVDYDDLASHLDMKKISVLSYANDIDALVRRRLLKFRDVKDEDDFDIPTVVIRSLKHNEVYELPKRTGLDCASMFELFDQWFEDLDDDAISPHELNEELQSLFKENPQVGFVNHLKDYHLNDKDQMMVTFFCHLLVNKDDDDVRFGQIEDLFDNKADFIKAKAGMRTGGHKVMEKKIIEHLCEEGIANTSRYKLTEEAKRTLLGEMKLSSAEEKLADVLNHEQLTKKQLFFPKDIQRQVDELASFLQTDNYQKIHKRMKENGFRCGFACLFYGGPGTGKTETVYQLAQQTGRNIMVVDVPQLKSMWVGQSEKNVKALFDRYREQVKRAKRTPILLFNEADAIIGTRMNGAQRAVDKMENSIQNIILQEMENLDGIMIATTNLQQNLDTAFERRFLYKIKFEKPDAAIRQHLWQSMMPSLSETDAHMLAAAYDFSGGQIENVSRKATINAILYGNDANSIERLTDFCNAERLEGPTRKIGFTTPFVV